MAWKPSKKIELNTSHQISTWRQVLEKETKLAKGKTKGDFEKLEGSLDQKNAYMHLFKNETRLQQDEDEKKQEIYVYDQVKADEKDRGYC